MLTATRPYSERWLGKARRFAAHAPFYPVCWAYNRVPGFEFRELTGAPVLLQVGALDAYDPPGAPEALRDEAEKLAPGLLTLVAHAGATHAFDRSAEPDMVVTDPFAHGGRGGEVRSPRTRPRRPRRVKKRRNSSLRCLGFCSRGR